MDVDTRVVGFILGGFGVLTGLACWWQARRLAAAFNWGVEKGLTIGPRVEFTKTNVRIGAAGWMVIGVLMLVISVLDAWAE